MPTSEPIRASIVGCSGGAAPWSTSSTSRSFGDSDGDGIGDLDGLRARLGYLELLGVDIVWLEPTPIADRRTVDPLVGDLAAFDALVEAVVELQLRLVADLVRDNGHPQYHRS